MRRGRAWLGVCHGRVDAGSARVLCRELGCGAVLALPEPGRFGAAAGPFWDGAFECDGSEPLLAACAARPTPEQRCSDPAAVVCSRKRGAGGRQPAARSPRPHLAALSLSLLLAAYTGFRLADGGSPCAGRVEAEERGTWGALCAGSLELPDAHVLCRHLGCGPAASVQPGGRFGAGKGPLRRDRLGCVGNERHPGECPAAVLGEPACEPALAAAVICSGAAESLRLRGGESRCDGRLEVALRPDVWSGVSAGSRDNGTAAVACRQLGCGVPEKAYAAPAVGPGLAELRCEGGEESLARCDSPGVGRGPSALTVSCSGGRPGKGRGRRASPPGPDAALPCRRPAAEAGGRPRALRRQGGGVRRRRLELRVPGRVEPAGRRRRLPPAALRDGPGGARPRALRLRSRDAVGGRRGLRGDGGGALGLPGAARLRRRRRSGGGVLR